MDRTAHDKRMIAQSKKIDEAYKKNLLVNKSNKLTVKQQELYDLIGRFPDITSKQIKFCLGITRSTLGEHMENLELRGLVLSKSGTYGMKHYSQKKFKTNKQRKII